MDHFFLTLKPKRDDVIPGDLLEKIWTGQELHLRDFDVSFAHSFTQLMYNYKAEIIEEIIEDGFTNFIEIGLVNEDVVGAGTPQNKIIPILQKFLNKVDVDHELIILDPYFFAPTRISNYADLIESILLPYLVRLTTLRIITTDNPGKIDLALKGSIETKLKAHNAGLQIIHTRSANYHDRFWISGGREKGLVSGTSLNGLGNRLALIDRLNTTDVREIVAALAADGLI